MGPLSVKVIAVNEYKNDLIEDSLLAQGSAMQSRRTVSLECFPVLVNRR